MPYPGTVNNPGGSNSYITGQGGEEPYGAIERRKVLTRMSPIKKNPALNAPRRAQTAATKKQAPPATPVQTTAQDQGQVDQAQAQAMPEKPQDPVMIFWQSLAADPQASPLVQRYAAMATAGASA